MLDDPSTSFATYQGVTGRAVSRPAIDMFRLAWTLSDLAAFINVLRSSHRDDQDTQRAWTNVQVCLPARATAASGPYRFPT